jgi:hypothetical protein
LERLIMYLCNADELHEKLNGVPLAPGAKK